MVRHGVDNLVEFRNAGRQLPGRQPNDGVYVGVDVGVGPAAYRGLADNGAVDSPKQVYGAGGNVLNVEILLRGGEVSLAGILGGFEQRFSPSCRAAPPVWCPLGS